ncbi:hypothetical protein ACLK17_14340 [Escherichia coli]
MGRELCYFWSRPLSEGWNIAVLGATGAVGEALLETLAERQFPVGEIYALARNESAGEQLRFGGKTITVQDAAELTGRRRSWHFLSQAKKLPLPGLKKRPTQVAW